MINFIEKEKKSVNQMDHLHSVFMNDITNERLRKVVICNEILDISLNDFISLVIAENAPYNYKK